MYWILAEYLEPPYFKLSADEICKFLLYWNCNRIWTLGKLYINGLWPVRHLGGPESVHVVFVMGKVALGQYFGFPLLILIPPFLLSVTRDWYNGTTSPPPRVIWK
jgi:hypothetical protein